MRSGLGDLRDFKLECRLSMGCTIIEKVLEREEK